MDFYPAKLCLIVFLLVWVTVDFRKGTQLEIVPDSSAKTPLCTIDIIEYRIKNSFVP